MKTKRENLSESNKGNDLIELSSECEEKSNKKSDINFESFIEELKKEYISYELPNKEAQYEEIKNESEIDLRIFKKQSNGKAEGKVKRKFEGEIDKNDDYLLSHDYLMRRKFREGRRLHLIGKYKEAKKLFKESAEGGCMEGMHCLAIVYNNGEGCKKSIKKASYWVSMAIQKGDLKAKQTLNNIRYEAEVKLVNCFIF